MFDEDDGWMWRTALKEGETFVLSELAKSLELGRPTTHLTEIFPHYELSIVDRDTIIIKRKP
jgi:hypothetical protein